MKKNVIILVIANDFYLVHLFRSSCFSPKKISGDVNYDETFFINKMNSGVQE